MQMQQNEKVIALSEREALKSIKPDKGWRKRIAMQVVMQLPDEYSDAKAVLQYANELLDGFLANDN